MGPRRPRDRAGPTRPSAAIGHGGDHGLRRERACGSSPRRSASGPTRAAGLDAAERAEWDRYRDHKPELPDAAIIVANLKYKARPLDGVWATPPYLHNASVPNLDALLSPVALRPVTFPIGTTVYDTKLVGFRTDVDPGEFSSTRRLRATTTPATNSAT